MSEEDGAKLYDVYPHVSDSVRALIWLIKPDGFKAFHVKAYCAGKSKDAFVFRLNRYLTIGCSTSIIDRDALIPLLMQVHVFWDSSTPNRVTCVFNINQSGTLVIMRYV